MLFSNVVDHCVLIEKPNMTCTIESPVKAEGNDQQLKRNPMVNANIDRSGERIQLLLVMWIQPLL